MNQHFKPEVTTTFAELCDRIQGFNFDEDQSPSELKQLVGGLRLLSTDVVARWQKVSEMEKDLASRITMAEVREGMQIVLGITSTGKPGFFQRLRYVFNV